MATLALEGGRFGVAAEDLTRQGTWLVSRRYDLAFIILSPRSWSSRTCRTRVMGKNIYVDLTVTLLIGGPHLFATYTMTFMEPRFRERWPRYTLGALLLPPLIVTLAIVNLTLLVTIFFLWASVHVIHQVAYVTDAYRMKDPRGWDWTGRVIDYGLLATAMYPIATEKFIKGQFQTGGRTLLFPEFLKQPWVAWPVWAAFIGFALAFAWKSAREWREGRLHPAKTLLMVIATVLFFLTPMLANLDVAFQGLNTWHSFQYLAIVLYLNRYRAAKGLIGSEFVTRVSRRGHDALRDVPGLHPAHRRPVLRGARHRGQPAPLRDGRPLRDVLLRADPRRPALLRLLQRDALVPARPLLLRPLHLPATRPRDHPELRASVERPEGQRPAASSFSRAGP